MNIHNLSQRLHLVSEHIPKGARFADIGSDHAYLPCYAILNNIASSAIAGEVNKGPFHSALSQVKEHGLQHVIDVRLGDGLAVLTNNDQVDAITICGMGGELITSILEEGKEKLSKVNRLILQPNVGAIHIRKWLLINDWELKAEQILEEDTKIYEILIAERGKPSAPYSKKMDLDLLVGPFLKEERNAAFLKKWEHEIEGWKQILKQLERSKNKNEVMERKKEIEERITMVEEVVKNELH